MLDWKLQFCRRMNKKHKKTPNFKDWYVFELLPQHLEFEALQKYESWTIFNEVQLQEVERYYKRRVEFIFALKKGAIASLISPTFKRECGSRKLFVEDHEAQSSGIVKKKKGKSFVEESILKMINLSFFLRMA